MKKATENLIRERARNCCEYCRMPQEYEDLPFQFDHIIAKSHGGTDGGINRAWACVPCNLYKGSNLSGVDPLTGKVTRLFDPRRQNWKRHFRWNGAILEGKRPQVAPRFGLSGSTCRSVWLFASLSSTSKNSPRAIPETK
jgi:hypothetical protein